eukprot:4951892-Prymnesium_polylepis.1
MDDDDLYSVLGIPRTASAQDITSAYRRLSRTYHPDRRLDPDEKRVAGPHWLKISAAYDVLADGKKRMVYDELGGTHLREGLALVRSKPMHGRVNTPEELHREWRRAQARSSEATQMGRMGASGSIVISTSLAHVLQPPDASTPVWRRLYPELSSVAMVQEMRLQPDRKHTLTVSNQTVSKQGLGGSTLRLGFMRALSARSTLQLASSIGYTPYALDVVATRRLSAHSTANATATVSGSGLSAVSLSVRRQLSSLLLGEMSLSLPTLSWWGLPPSDESALRLTLQRTPTRQREDAEREADGDGSDDGSDDGDGADDADADADAERDGTRASADGGSPS